MPKGYHYVVRWHTMAKTTERGLKTPKVSFEIIKILKEEDGAGVSRIAERFGRPVSTVHGHLTTLKQCGYVIQEGNEYNLSLKFVDLGNYVVNRTQAYKIADTYTEKVAEKTGCRSIFAVEENGRGVYISRNSGEHSRWSHEQIGNRFYLHTTAAGKAILAHLSRTRVKEIIDRWGLPKQTEDSITDEDELMEELQEVREAGIGFNREEEVSGVRAVSVPLVSDSGKIIGALSANGPANQLVGDWYEEELPQTLLGIVNEFQLDLTLTE